MVPLYGNIILLNIEQLNGVETGLVERFYVSLTNKVTPDVMNGITNTIVYRYIVLILVYTTKIILFRSNGFMIK